MGIASEHLPDDAVAIPRLVSAIRTGHSVQPVSCKDAILRVDPGGSAVPPLSDRWELGRK
jgi:hypothetical protein